MKKLILSLVVLMSLTITNCSKNEENATNPKEENPSNPQNPQAPQQPPTPPQPQAPRQTQEPPISSADFTLSPDGKTLVRWNNTTRTTLDMKSHPLLSQVTTIGFQAFKDRNSLKTIIFPETLTTIKGYAFSGSGLESITIPETISFIGDYAFSNCNRLVSASVPKSAYSLGIFIFEDSANLKEVTYGPTIVKGELFRGCTSLKKVTLLEGVTSIEFKAFYNLTGLKEIHFASSTNIIKNYAFSGSGLESITIPETISYIGDYAFSNCNKLVSASIPKSANSLGIFIFENSTNLKEVTYGPTIVKGQLFRDCTSLKKVTLLEGVTSVEFKAFYNLPGLREIHFAGSTNTIKGYAFSGSGLESITIPETISYIGDYAFSNCNRLVSASVPKSANSLGISIFENSTNLKEVTYGPTIAKNLFSGCTNLEKVTLLEGINTIDFQAFNNLTNLTTLILKTTTPPFLGYNALNNTGLTHIYVPAASVDTYKNDRKWRVFADKIQAIP